MSPSARRGSVDSGDSFSLLPPHDPNVPFPSNPGVAFSRDILPAPTPMKPKSNAWKRASLPASNNYADILARTDWDNLPSRRQLERTVINGYHDNAPRPRQPVYDAQFKYRDTPYGARERVHRDSPVIAELRTNVIIKDEFTLVTDLSYHLAARYTRPDSSIMIKIDHSACLALGGTFDPCYILSITAVPTQMGPAMNKRNASLIQSFLAEILSVPPERGVIKFEAIQEENLAINGSTLLGEIERQEKQQALADRPVVRKPAMSAGQPNRMSIPAFRRTNSNGYDESGQSGHVPQPGPLDRVVIPNGTFNTPNGLFELGAGDHDRARPQTSYGASSDGYRLNSMPNRDSMFRDLPPAKQRPKSMVADAQAIEEQLMEYRNRPLLSQNFQNGAALPPLNQSSSFPAMVNQRQYPVGRTDSARSGLNGSMNGRTAPNFSQGARHSHAMITESKSLTSKDSYLGSLIETPANTETDATRRTPVQADLAAKDTAANTAKRRSTITATPKMLSPPPVPSETNSLKSSKVGKRKSFMKALRRVTATS